MWTDSVIEVSKAGDSCSLCVNIISHGVSISGEMCAGIQESVLSSSDIAFAACRPHTASCSSHCCCSSPHKGQQFLYVCSMMPILPSATPTQQCWKGSPPKRAIKTASHSFSSAPYIILARRPVILKICVLIDKLLCAFCMSARHWILQVGEPLALEEPSHSSCSDLANNFAERLKHSRFESGNALLWWRCILNRDDFSCR